MNKYITSRLFLLLLPLTLWLGCTHETDFFDGPNLVDRFGEFSLLEDLTVNRTTVDFSAGEVVTLQARFNKRIAYQIIITGEESGAVKIIDGFDSELNVDNATWRGGTTTLPLFRQEAVTIELLIPELPDFSRMVRVEVLGTRVYEGNLFTDFETDPGSNIFFGNFEFELSSNTRRTNDGNAAQGDWYYFFEGTDNVVPNFFVGLINISSSITGQTYAPVPTTDPENLYFNAFLYADGGPHGIAVIQFVFDSNNTGAFEDGQDQTFQLAGDFPLDWTGWRQISHTMAEIGMTEAQVQKIVAIRVLLISDLNSQPTPPLPVDFGIDFLTFTAGGPLEP